MYISLNSFNKLGFVLVIEMQWIFVWYELTLYCVLCVLGTEFLNII
jgi:hypothetical protein